MRWIRRGERFVYENQWMSVSLVDVEVPDGRRFEHHSMHSADAAGTLIVDSDQGVLLLWRHRILSDTWGWEIPAGRVDDGETPIEAAEREATEETGWRPGPLRQLASYQPVNGVSAMRFHLFLADGATHVGDPADPTEAERIEWVSVDRLRAIIAGHQMPDGLSLTACLYALAVCGLD